MAKRSSSQPLVGKSTRPGRSKSQPRLGKAASTRAPRLGNRKRK